MARTKWSIATLGLPDHTFTHPLTIQANARFGLSARAPRHDHGRDLEVKDNECQSVSGHTQQARLVAIQLQRASRKAGCLGNFQSGIFQQVQCLASLIAPRSHAVGQGKSRIEGDRPIEEKLGLFQTLRRP